METPSAPPAPSREEVLLVVTLGVLASGLFEHGIPTVGHVWGLLVCTAGYLAGAAVSVAAAAPEAA